MHRKDTIMADNKDELDDLLSDYQILEQKKVLRKNQEGYLPPAAKNTPPVHSGTRPQKKAASHAITDKAAPAPQKRPTYRHRKAARPNGAVLLFALLVIGISVLSIQQIIHNDDTPVIDNSLPSQPGESSSNLSDIPPIDTEESTPEEPVTLWNTVSLSADAMHSGDLILVNYAHSYAQADTVSVSNVYSGKNKYYKISTSSISLTEETLSAMNVFAENFYKETSNDDIIIVSGYRDVASQKRIYDDRVATQGAELAALYVATPGYSEHHTGMAMDLSFYTDDGASVSIENHEFGFWINAHCAEYGFVLRYPADKINITKIGYESWHYRYVGIPHAQIMTSRNLCLEEYIEFLKNYTPETKMLWVQPNGTIEDISVTALPKEGYLIYYVPAIPSGTTDIPVPRGNIFENYEISGNNVDGFIVTVTIGT